MKCSIDSRYRPLLLIVMLAVFLFAFKRGNEPQYMDLTGEAPGKDGLEVTLLKDPYGKTEVLATDTIRNGSFHMRCAVTEIMTVYVSIRENKMRSTYPVILEGAKVNFKLTEGGSIASGGKYNQWILGYQRDPGYIHANEAFARSKKTPLAKDKEWQSIQDFLQQNELRSQYLQKVLNNGKDPVAAAIAAVLLELQPDRIKSMEIVNKAAAKLGENSVVISAARSINKAQEEMEARRHGKMVGESFYDFTAATLQGDSVHLAPMVTSNKYTLLQFWASWCAPCRAEIPLLKKMYASLHTKGLEIVSFSMDNNQLNWQKASEIEKFNWQNISDLLADKSPVIKNYPVIGIPANVIIGQDGKIVASNLTGDDLENKLKELLK